MRKRYVTFAVIGVMLLIGIQFVPSDPTQKDLLAIKRAVGKRTSGDIVRIEPLLSGAVEVQTALFRGLYGDAQSFRLRKVFGKWWIYREEHQAIVPREAITPATERFALAPVAYARVGLTSRVTE